MALMLLLKKVIYFPQKFKTHNMCLFFFYMSLWQFIKSLIIHYMSLYNPRIRRDPKYNTLQMRRILES